MDTSTRDVVAADTPFAVGSLAKPMVATDNPTVRFDDDVLYVMVWALPRVRE